MYNLEQFKFTSEEKREIESLLGSGLKAWYDFKETNRNIFLIPKDTIEEDSQLVIDVKETKEDHRVAAITESNTLYGNFYYSNINQTNKPIVTYKDFDIEFNPIFFSDSNKIFISNFLSGSAYHSYLGGSITCYNKFLFLEERGKTNKRLMNLNIQKYIETKNSNIINFKIYSKGTYYNESILIIDNLFYIKINQDETLTNSSVGGNFLSVWDKQCLKSLKTIQFTSKISSPLYKIPYFEYVDSVNNVVEPTSTLVFPAPGLSRYDVNVMENGNMVKKGETLLSLNTQESTSTKLEYTIDGLQTIKRIYRDVVTNQIIFEEVENIEVNKETLVEPTNIPNGYQLYGPVRYEYDFFKYEYEFLIEDIGRNVTITYFDMVNEQVIKEEILKVSRYDQFLRSSNFDDYYTTINILELDENVSEYVVYYYKKTKDIIFNFVDNGNTVLTKTLLLDTKTERNIRIKDYIKVEEDLPNYLLETTSVSIDYNVFEINIPIYKEEILYNITLEYLYKDGSVYTTENRMHSSYSGNVIPRELSGMISSPYKINFEPDKSVYRFTVEEVFKVIKLMYKTVKGEIIYEKYMKITNGTMFLEVPKMDIYKLLTTTITISDSKDEYEVFVEKINKEIEFTFICKDIDSNLILDEYKEKIDLITSNTYKPKTILTYECLNSTIKLSEDIKIIEILYRRIENPLISKIQGLISKYIELTTEEIEVFASNSIHLTTLNINVKTYRIAADILEIYGLNTITSYKDAGSSITFDNSVILRLANMYREKAMQIELEENIGLIGAFNWIIADGR